jgi:hypothetical protein
MSGVLDRVSLSYLSPGLQYEVEKSLARYLISCGAAEEVASTQPAFVIPADDPYVAHLTGGITVSHGKEPLNDVAADRPAKGRRKRR